MMVEGGGAQGTFQGNETTLCDLIMVATCHYTFVQTQNVSCGLG